MVVQTKCNVHGRELEHRPRNLEVPCLIPRRFLGSSLALTFSASTGVVPRKQI